MINAPRSVSRVTQPPVSELLTALFAEHKASHAHGEHHHAPSTDT